MQEGAPPNLAESAAAALDQMLGMLGEGCDPPAAAEPLRTAIAGGDQLDIGEKLYLLLVEQTLEYDFIDGKFSKTKIDWSKTDDDKVKEKMTYIYTYGIKMLTNGVLSEDALREAVLNKVASKVNMDGPAFDKWLAIPAVK